MTDGARPQTERTVASDLRAGDVAEHRPAPGSQRVVYVEVIKTRRLPAGNISGRDIEVTWRRINEPSDLTFLAAYDADERIDTIRAGSRP